MKKNKNEKNEMPGIIKNSKIDSGISGNEENLPETNYPSFPLNEDMYLNESESELKSHLDQDFSYSDNEKKQNENNPLSEMSEYPAIPFLVNLKPNFSAHADRISNEDDKGGEQGDDSGVSGGGNSHHDEKGKQNDDF